MFKAKKKKTMQEVAQDGNILMSPEYLTMCAQAIKSKCENTPPGTPCIFARDGTCRSNCSIPGNTPDNWPEKHWKGVKR